MGLLSFGAKRAARGLRALHSSPHDFDRFAMNNIGGGEGSQAFAHGLYFTDDDVIANFYRDYFKKQGKTPKTYEVNLNVSPDDLVDWDKPISKQSRKIQDAFAELYGVPRSQLRGGQKPQPKGPAESAFLKERGIPGVVFDAGAFWGGAPGGARNYVMFDENLIDIMRKYGLIGSLGGGGLLSMGAAQRQGNQY